MRKNLPKIKLTQGQLLNVTDVDAWVTFLSPEMEWGGALNQSIMATVGKELDEYVLDNIHQPKEGQAFVTPAFGAPVDKLVIIILPKWEGGFNAEDQLLARGYKNATKLAVQEGISSLAFPSLGAGRKGFPQLRAARIALCAIAENMQPPLGDVRIVCKEVETYRAYEEKMLSLMQRDLSS